MVCMVKKSCKSFWCLRGHGVKFFSFSRHLKNLQKLRKKEGGEKIQKVDFCLGQKIVVLYSSSFSRTYGGRIRDQHSSSTRARVVVP